MDSAKTRESSGNTLSSRRTAPLKPKPGLSGPPVRFCLSGDVQIFSIERLNNLAWSSHSSRLPQLDRISVRVMQAGETAVGIRLRVNLDRDSCGS